MHVRTLGRERRGEQKLAEIVISLETDLAKTSRARADLRDEEKNYNRIATSELLLKFPLTHLPTYLTASEVRPVEYVVVGQPEFFAALDKLLSEKPIEHLRAYLRWHVLHSYASFLHSAVENEDFDFFHRKLVGQEKPEARWKRATRTIDGMVGEALGKLYVEKHFPPEARQRVALLIEDVKAVFRERLQGLPWMTEATRQKALAKFDKVPREDRPP